jgi:hypothetical protein
MGNKKGTHYFLLQKSSKVDDRVTEVDGDDGDCSVDSGRGINNILKVHKVGHKAIS